jgi:AICAR transformylase/IMP cyclohydrolase PurH
MAKAKSDLTKAEEEAAALVGEKVTPTSSAKPKEKVTPPFYEWNGTAYATKEDLDKAMTDSFVPRAVFTQKTQALSARQKEYDKKELDLRFREENAKKLESEYQKYDNFIKSPQGQRVYGELQRLTSQGMSPSDFKEQMKEEWQKEYGMDINEFKEFVRDYKANQAKEAAFKSLSEKYGDKFNSDEVTKAVDELYDGDMSTLYELAHHAVLGRSATQDVLTTDQPSGATRADTMPSGGGVATVPTPETEPHTTDEALQMANAELGITEEDYD